MVRVISKPQRAFVLFLMLVMLITGFGSVGNAGAATDYVDKTENGSMHRTDLSDIEDELTSTTYDEYLKINSYTSDLHATERIDLDIFGGAKPESDDTIIGVLEGFGTEGATADKALVVGDSGGVVIEFDAPASAFYALEVTYYSGSIYIYSSKTCNEGSHELIFSAVKTDDYPESTTDDNVCGTCGASLVAVNSKNSAIERKIFIDDSIPYKEARSVEFQRSWIDVYSTKGDAYYSNTDSFNDKVSSDKVSDRVFPTDVNGNEKKPEKAIYDEWVTTKVYDSTGYASDPLMFYLEEGTHTITLEAIREPAAFASVAFVPVETTKTYKEYLADIESQYGDAAKDVPAGTEVTVQAEHSYKTSSNTIYQTSDRASCLTEPQDVSVTKLNEIGGDKWQYVGQWIEWEVEIETAGFYKIVPRSIQDFYSGVYVSRKLYIDNVLPFAEAANLRFNYSDSWQTETLTDGTTDFKFYFTEGKHIIRMEVVLGEMAQVLSQVEASLNNINSYYRSILMITGPDPDEYRDYSFEKMLPEVVRGLRNEAKNLKTISAKLSDIIGYTGDHSVTLDKVAQTVEQMGNYPSKIASLMDDLKTQSGSLGTWLTQTQNQPLNIDYFKFMAPNDENPEAEAGFFRELWQEIKKFIMSFFTDYTSISSSSDSNAVVADDEHTIEVWVTTGRDQASILRNLVDDSFTAQYPGIDVRVKLVAAGTLLPSTLAGTGPDVSLGNAQTEAINYAIRSAVMALNDKDGDNGYNFNDFSAYENDSVYSNYYKDDEGNVLYLDENGNETTTPTDQLAWRVDYFDEVKTRFADEATVPLTIYGKTYGIPENMSFYMMFYRKDILTELGLSVPNTWDEFYQMIYTLQSNKLEIGFPSGVTGSTIWMYQQGDTMYDMGNYEAYMEKYGDELRESGNTYIDEEGNEIPKTDGMTINLDSDIALACFKDVCQLYTMYDFPVTYDFANRFRSGEMPIAIADYTAYNQLIVFAPEINGMWEFTPLPGTMDKDGVINNTTVGTVTSMMMMRSVEDRGNEFAAYVFMQWWSGKEAQSSYGTEMEALLGPSAKQNTANEQALYDMPWSNEEFENLYSQFQDVTCTPEFPGGYIIARYTNFAFLAVYNEDAEPVEELLSNIPLINAELSRKREEFGLPIAENYPLDED